MSQPEFRSLDDLKSHRWHDSPTEAQSARIRVIFKSVQAHEGFEKFEDSFLYNLHIDNEIAVWERIAAAVDRVCHIDPFFESMRTACGDFFAAASVSKPEDLGELARNCFGPNRNRFVRAQTQKDA